jgi:hypothetical protein
MQGELNSVFLLGAFALAVVLACRCLLKLVFDAPRVHGWTRWIFVAAALILTAILAGDAIRGVARSESQSLAPILGLSVVALALLSLPLHLHVASLRLPARDLLRRPATWVVLAWAIGASGWSAVRLYQSQLPAPSEVTIAPRPVPAAERNAFGVSDRGNPISLFRIQPQLDIGPAGFQPTTPAIARITQTVIRRDGPSFGSNCHGWVFAGGRYLIDGSAVQTILEDNGYTRCSDPRMGDVIVYWSRGEVVHTGLVGGVLADGTVLIESKWNLQERFLHRPEDQPYSQEFTFFRTNRGTHQITIRERPALAPRVFTSVRMAQ